MSKSGDATDTATTSERDEQLEFEVLTTALRALQSLGPDARVRVFGAIGTFLGIASSSLAQSRTPGSGSSASADVTVGVAQGSFSQDRTQSPKEFLFEKRPQSDVDRIACLAYYLTHYRGTAHFKTLDLSKLNTEAAQLKLSNAAYAVDNATKRGFLVPASKGAKQLSTLGEIYVQALPDQAGARAAIADALPKRKFRRGGRPGGARAAVDVTEDQ